MKEIKVGSVSIGSSGAGSANDYTPQTWTDSPCGHGGIGLMKVYTFELTIFEGNDKFWETNPTDQAVREMVLNTLIKGGMFVEDGHAVLALKKSERR